MSLKRGVAALYAGQIYAAVAGVALTPLFLRLLGPEGYGLVGVFIVLQAWLQVLDLGLPTLLARQVASLRAGGATLVEASQALRSTEWLFACIGLVAVGGMLATTQWLVASWFSPRVLPPSTVQHALALMVLTCGLRWMTSPYRAVLIGFEQLGWLAGAGAVFTTLRFVAVLPWMYYSAHPVEAFFIAQLGIGMLELVLHVGRAYAALPTRVGAGWGSGLAWLGNGGPALGWTMAGTTIIWFLATQIDRVVLSKLLPLADYGYYTLAMAVATTMMQLTAPLGAALVPRLSRLHAMGNEDALRRTYRNLTQGLCALTMCFAAVISMHAHSVVFVWTGDATAAGAVAPVLAPYVIAQALLAVLVMPYHLQLARGDLRLHAAATIALALLIIPAIVWAAPHWGAVGAGFAWLIALLVYTLLWLPLVHRRFLPGVHARWLFNDLLGVAVPLLLVSYATTATRTWWPQARLGQLACLGLVWLLVAATALATSPVARTALNKSLARGTAWRLG